MENQYYVVVEVVDVKYRRADEEVVPVDFKVYMQQIEVNVVDGEVVDVEYIP